MQKEKQKKILEIELSKIEEELHSLGREIDEQGKWVLSVNLPREERIDPLDDANLTEEVKGEMAVFTVLIKRYEQVKKALFAIEKETYGICELCRVQINEKRLQVNPSATTCIRCTG